MLTMTTALILTIVLILVLARYVAQLALGRLNQRHVRAHAAAVPEPFKEMVDEATYQKSVRYTLAKSRFGQVEETFDTALLIAVLFSGVLPWSYQTFSAALGQSSWAMAAYLFAVGLALSIFSLPLGWYAQFRLEQRFGFNTMTPKLWWTDRLKGTLLSLALGLPVLALILKLAAWAGPWWWLWAWGAILVFQLVMMVLAPILILPLFNKLTPLPEGSLRDRLLGLAERTGFRTRGIHVMDGSKRSRHSNAFFTGFGRFRKIVLFDTLMEQLREAELEAVLAHEIGHYQRRHLPRLLLWSAASLLAAFYALSVLAREAGFYRAFGFEPGEFAAALLLFGLLSGTVGFWLTPLANFWSRRYEYQADAYAAEVVGEPQPLMGALRKLNEKNLSNLTPHPLYSGFYYSHPTLLEREKALLEAAKLTCPQQPGKA
jgi:STE24 endopeptidase